jgi:hypothetical protein
MIDGFAQAELAVSKVLLAMAQGPEPGSKLKLPHLAGLRYADLAKCLEVANPRSAHTRSALRAIERLQGHGPLRALLCHGAVTVRPGRDGRWVAVFRMLVFNEGSANRVTRAIDEPEAERLLAEVTAHCRQLCSVLGQFREPARLGAVCGSAAGDGFIRASPRPRSAPGAGRPAA